MEVYIFPTSISAHIDIAIRHHIWAIHNIGERQRAARFTKSQKMKVGSAGIFYLSDVKAFSVPFETASMPVDKTVSGVWPDVWHFPFSIRPLGTTRNQISLARAKNQWATLRGVRNVTTHLCLSGSMAFVSSAIEDGDWRSIMTELTENGMV